MKTYKTNEERIRKMGAKQLRAELAHRDREVTRLYAKLAAYESFFQSFKDMLRIDRADVSNLD